MSVLDRYLKKKQVDSVTDLNAEELETYNRWEQMLRGRKLTDNDVEEFLEAELRETITKLPQQHLGSADDIFLKVKLDMILKIQGFLNAPKLEKQALEAALTSEVETLL